MIPKSLDDISEADLCNLIENQVTEGRTIEYKRELPSGTDKGKKEFLADVSSFANTAGGDILYGIVEEQGLPIEIVGIQSGDLDAETLRLEGTLDTGLEPRIRRHIRRIDCENGEQVLLIRIERSWVGPHRVCFQQRDQFWGHNDAGKYRLDMTELKTAFMQSDTLTERIRAFRADRIIAISNGELPVKLLDGPKCVMHCIPMESFTRSADCDIIRYFKQPQLFPGIEDFGNGRRLTLEGLVITDAHSNLAETYYVHVYRNGLIEAVCGGLIHKDSNGSWLNTYRYEKPLINYLPTCIQLLSDFEMNEPYFLSLTLTNAKEYRLWNPNPFSQGGYPIDRDTLVLPEVLPDESAESSESILKPLFDYAWNDCGYEHSRYFNAEGKWVEPRY